MRRSWRLSSSNLRICLKMFQKMDFDTSYTVAQFQWIYLEGTYYLYNTRSEIILAAVKMVDARPFIRYRTKSRYRHIIETWAKSTGAVCLASNHVGRWERRMRHLLGSGVQRQYALRDYGVDILHLDLDTVHMRDSLSGRPMRDRRRNTRPTTMEQLLGRPSHIRYIPHADGPIAVDPNVAQGWIQTTVRGEWPTVTPADFDPIPDETPDE